MKQKAKKTRKEQLLNESSQTSTLRIEDSKLTPTLTSKSIIQQLKSLVPNRKVQNLNQIIPIEENSTTNSNLQSLQSIKNQSQTLIQRQDTDNLDQHESKFQFSIIKHKLFC